MSVEQRFSGTTEAGEEVRLYTLSNKKGVNAQVINYGAILVRLFVPDKNGKAEDIVLGFDDVEDYSINSSFFGTTVGPSANRIKNAKFEIDGVEYHLAVNDGPNNLHSDFDKAFHKRVWKTETTDDSVIFSLESPDGDMGFPGNKKFSVTYTLTEDSELKIHYQGSSDKKTIMNMTNHSYFNLGGHGSGNVCNDIVWIDADHYTPIVAGAIPTGEIAPVAGTPLDFTQPKRVGRDLEADFDQLKLVGGYDHNLVLKDAGGKCRLFARVENEASGRKMEVYTDLPGVQFFTANGLDAQTGKEGVVYGKWGALCLETQYFPDSINEPAFPQPVFGAGKLYDTTTVYKFL